RLRTCRGVRGPRAGHAQRTVRLIAGSPIGGAHIMVRKASSALALLAALVAGEGGVGAQSRPSARETFERLKALAGRWEASTTDEQNRPLKAPVTYEVVSGGTTVLERIVEGQSDMVSAFHIDGDR